MMLPTYRSRYLPAMRIEEIEAIPCKEQVPVIIPVGAVEQHGPHLPVGVDAILGQHWLNLALPKLPEAVSVFIAPPITIGKSDEHQGFPGTLFISARTLGRLLTAIARQLHAWGFRTFAVLNTHGGNISVLRYTMRELQVELEVCFHVLSLGYKPPLPAQEAAYGFHANTMETACMLAATEGLIDMSKARCEYPARIEDPGELKPEEAPATFAWITRDISESGIVGNAPAATQALGQEWSECFASGLAGEILRLVETARQAVMRRQARRVPRPD